MNRILNLQVQLLLAQHGRRRVIEAVADADGADLESIQKELDAMRTRSEGRAKPTGKTRRKKELDAMRARSEGGTKPTRKTRRKSARELIEAARIDPGVKPLVERIATGYEDKEYLSELWRVKRFLESEGVDVTRIRSRADALPRVIEVLANRSPERLEALLKSWGRRGSRNDLAVLAEAIMGSGKGAAPPG